MCEGDSPAAEQARQGVSAFHASFTPRDAGASPVVEVAESPQSGGTAAFDGQQVTVDGQTLEDVVVANSTGVEPGRIALGIVATEIDGRWYVTDLSLSFG
jgi:hypothetical protein